MQRRLLVHCYKGHADDLNYVTFEFVGQRLVSIPVVRNGDAEALSRVVEIAFKGCCDPTKESPEVASMTAKLFAAFEKELTPSGMRRMEEVQLRVMQILHD
jgi:hypothetical protein